MTQTGRCDIATLQRDDDSHRSTALPTFERVFHVPKGIQKAAGGVTATRKKAFGPRVPMLPRNCTGTPSQPRYPRVTLHVTYALQAPNPQRAKQVKERTPSALLSEPQAPCFTHLKQRPGFLSQKEKKNKKVKQRGWGNSPHSSYYHTRPKR